MLLWLNARRNRLFVSSRLDLLSALKCIVHDRGTVDEAMVIAGSR